ALVLGLARIPQARLVDGAKVRNPRCNLGLPPLHEPFDRSEHAVDRLRRCARPPDEPLGLEPLEQPLPLERRRADTERDGAEHGGAAEVSARLPGHGEAGPAEIDAEPGEQGTDASRTALTRREAVAQRSP